MQDDIKQKILQELGIASLPKESQDEIVARLGENIFKRTLVDITESLSPEDQKKLEEVPEGDEMLAFLQAHAPNAQELLEKNTREVVAEFKESAGL